MRSTRATELIEIYPAHMVNAWLGHTEAVAMAHYRQTTGKAAEKFFEQAAGVDKPPTGKNGGKTVGEHAGIALPGVEVKKTDIAVSPYISTPCNDSRCNAKSAKPPPIAGQGFEPRLNGSERYDLLLSEPFDYEGEETAISQKESAFQHSGTWCGRRYFLSLGS